MRLVSILIFSLLLTSCDVKRDYGQQVLLSDGRIIHAKYETVVGPNEFLLPGQGPTKQLEVTFSSPAGDVVWPGTVPESGRRTGSLFPDAFHLLGDTPVVVMTVVDGQCPHFGNPENSLVAYAYEQNKWKRISSDHIPLSWRLNLMGMMNNRFLQAGHTYTIEEIRGSSLVSIDPQDYSKNNTLEQKIERLRKMRLLCSQKGT